MKTTNKRSTIYLEPDLHRTLKIKAAQTNRTISDLVNEAVQLSLQEDLEDIRDVNNRISEPDIPFEEVLTDLKSRGKI